MKILFITSTHLGDAILSTGILDHLIVQHPGAEITVACGSVPAALFQDMPGLKKIQIVQKKKGGLHWLILWGRCVMTKWDLVVDLLGTGLSYFLWAQKRRVWRSKTTELLKSKQLAKFMGLTKTPFNKIWIGDPHLKVARHLLPVGPTYIALSPASNWDKKTWPQGYFAELTTKLLKHKDLFPHPKFVIFGAAHERQNLETLFAGLPADRTIDLMGKIHLLEVAACLKQCKLFVGNDSGLMHLSATMGTPTVGLFGPSDSRVYGPWGLKTLIIKNDLSFEENMAGALKGKNVMSLLKPDHVAKKILGFVRKVFKK